MFEAGLRGLAMLGGRTLDKGCITAMVRGAAAVKIDRIRSLDGASGVADIHDAVLQYRTNVSAVLKESKALRSFDNPRADEIVPTRNFIGALILARLPQKALRALDEAFKADATAKVDSIYNRIAGGKINITNAEEELVDGTKNNADRLAFTMLNMVANVSEALGEQPDALPEYEGKMDAEMKQLVPVVYADAQDLAREEVAGAAAV